ncbi:PepSY domain-containing protein [Falsiroseomonas ponticola]|uniref:PepSY domain-containing protein n=1 Tax=Falsiroseomonas ponticola TaxID=2786951 RepID=UPI0019317FDC|nr:PepSY domain-containing protein [Roseomonas ponticola]
MRQTLTAALLAASLALPAFAAPPPGNARPASEVVRMVEQRPDFAYLSELDWDDGGYWKVEYRTRDGAKVELRIDPVTGQPRPR